MKKTGIYSGGIIDEPVKSGFEIDNSIIHFGVIPSEVEWLSSYSVNSQIKNKYGKVTGTTKVVSIITIQKRLCPTNPLISIGLNPILGQKCTEVLQMKDGISKPIGD